MTITPTELLKQLHPDLKDENMVYYYRRGCKFFFRSDDKSKKIEILTSPYFKDEMLKSLKKNKVYSCRLT